MPASFFVVLLYHNWFESSTDLVLAFPCLASTALAPGQGLSVAQLGASCSTAVLLRRHWVQNYTSLAHLGILQDQRPFALAFCLFWCEATQRLEANNAPAQGNICQVCTKCITCASHVTVSTDWDTLAYLNEYLPQGLHSAGLSNGMRRLTPLQAANSPN